MPILRLITFSLRFAIRRIIVHPWLVSADLSCLLVIFTLATSIPIYTDAVYHRMFSENLFDVALEVNSLDNKAPMPSNRPAFSLLLRAFFGGSSLKTWQDIEPVDAYAKTGISQDLSLPLRWDTQFVASDNFLVYRWMAPAFSKNNPLLSTNFAYLKDIEQHISLLKTATPLRLAAGEPAPVDVMISEALSNQTGMQVGERYKAVFSGMKGSQVTKVEIPLRISGIWQANNAEEPFWYVPVDALTNQFIVSEASFQGTISTLVPKCISLVSWYLVMDENSVRYRDITSLLGKINVVRRTSEASLKSLSLDETPEKKLILYQKEANTLIIQLVLVSIPIVGLMMVFMNLITILSVKQRAAEIAMMRSRGFSVGQLLGVILVEKLIIAALALGLSIPAALALAWEVGKTRSFLNFSLPVNLPVAITPESLVFGLTAAGIVLAFHVAWTVPACQATISSYLRESSRTLGKPAWQRYWLDLWLFLPVIYGTYLLQKSGSQPITAQARGTLEDPLLMVLPLLACFSLTLFFIRLYAPLMEAFAWAMGHLPGAPILLSARQLARSPQSYTAPLMLLILTLGISGYVTSLAETVDRHLKESLSYQVGADLAFRDDGIPVIPAADQPGAVREPALNSGPDGAEVYYRDFLPASEYTHFTGVLFGTRVGRYSASVEASRLDESSMFMGVDAADFAQTAYWETGFSNQPLNSLMQQLAEQPDGVLVPESFMLKYSLSPGDTFKVTVTDESGLKAVMDLHIIGNFRYFPTWFPNNGLLIVGNLDYLFENAGREYPHWVWFRTAPGVDLSLIGNQKVRAFSIRSLSWEPTQIFITNSQQQPQRQGLFGLFSMSFVSAIVLTTLSFTIDLVFSFNRRAIQLGMLRAIGLTTRQMATMLAGELLLLVLPGILIGTAISVGVSRLFIPYFQVRGPAETQIPPYLVHLAWPQILGLCGLYGLLYVLSVWIMLMTMRRIKIFQAIKMGNSV